MRLVLPLLLLAHAAIAAAPAPTAPAAPARTLVAAKSAITFAGQQMGVAVKGRFAKFDADIAFDPAHPENAHAAVGVATASVTLDDSETDETVRSKPWLDAAGFPRAEFRSSGGFKALGKGRYSAAGTLTVKNKGQPATFEFTATEGKDGTLIAGELPIRRSVFGIGGGEWNSSDVVADAVTVQVRLLLAPAGK